MGTEAERQDTRKAMAFDLFSIIDKDPSKETYTDFRVCHHGRPEIRGISRFDSGRLLWYNPHIRTERRP